MIVDPQWAGKDSVSNTGIESMAEYKNTMLIMVISW